MEVQKILNSVYNNLRETEANSSWSKNSLIQWINDSLTKLSNEFQSERTSFTVSGNDVNPHPIPQDVLRWERVSRDGVTISPLTQNQARIDEAGTAHGFTGYIIEGGSIRFIPEPATGATYKVDYIKRVLPVVNEQANLDVPETWRMCIVYFVCAEAWANIGNMNRYQFWRARYDQELTEQRSREMDRQYPSPASPSVPSVEI